jgi:arabinose-5-phosphate isomerase
MDVEDAVASAREVISLELKELEAMAARLDSSFKRATEVMLAVQGRVVVLGMGKSGIIGQKIAATLASTGTPSFSVHPGEAFHGDLGMIKPDDVALMISNSGETEELIRLLPFMKHQCNRIIAMTGNIDSTLARHAHVVLDVSIEREACNINLAPTSSTTATLVMGDALAVVLMQLRNFQPEDFARFHPGGSLGRRLLTRIVDVMHRNNLPFCTPSASFREVINTITKGRLGLALVGDKKKLVGIITDGDIRRTFERYENPLSMVASEIMTPNPRVISEIVRITEAEEVMLGARITALVAIGLDGRVTGVLQVHDLATEIKSAVDVPKNSNNTSRRYL